MTEIINTPADAASKLVCALPHQTARDYACESVSNRALPPAVNGILLDAAAGYPVDVLKLRKAATAALDLARTRGKDRPASAEYARKARHLIHWADALIQQEVDQLPTWEPGARSPRIAELEEELRMARAERDSVLIDLHGAGIELDALREQNARYVAELGKTDQHLAGYSDISRKAEFDRDRYASTLEYALRFLAPCQQQRVFGYLDALTEA